MHPALPRKPHSNSRVRRAEPRDIDVLMELEHRVFATDRLSRRSLRRLLHSPTAEVLVAEEAGGLAGTAIVLFRAGSSLARLYSIAVAPHMGGRGVGTKLLEAVEDRARVRKRRAIRLEVHEMNHAAISRYRKSGYREFGRHRAYYEDGGDALRFEKFVTRKRPE
jgi:[ribosomal protein S18]-alanine N-acetyltransferase